MVKNPLASAGNPRDAGSILGREDPSEKEMATHSSILAWEIPWTEEPGGLQSMGSQRVGHDSMTNTHWAVRLSFWLFVLSKIHSLPESWAWFFVSNEYTLSDFLG